MKRIFLFVLDSFGIGAMPDSESFGDVGVNTLAAGATSKELNIPNMIAAGLGSIDGVSCLSGEHVAGACARLQEASMGKDTTIGHWEIAGIVSPNPLPTYPEGFPEEVLEPFRQATGRGILANAPWSGTAVIEDFGDEHVKTGDLIVYTSADSVMQICGNEETMGVPKLYEYCEIARELTMREEWKVGRIIARPYIRKADGTYERTANRHDYALKPFGRTVLNSLQDAGYDVISVGKIFDIFVGEGLTESNKSKSSVHGMEQTIEIAQKDFTGLCFTNLVDFDSEWGQRRNPVGYAEELGRFDEKLGELMPLLKEDDLLIITADHGNDPTYTGTDHTREKVPFLAWSPSMKEGSEIPEQDTFAVIGASVAENFGVEMPEGTIGTSILEELK